MIDTFTNPVLKRGIPKSRIFLRENQTISFTIDQTGQKQILNAIFSISRTEKILITKNLISNKFDKKKIVTNLAVIDIENNNFILKEYAPGVSVEEIKNATEGDLIIADSISEMCLQ